MMIVRMVYWGYPDCFHICNRLSPAGKSRTFLRSSCPALYRVTIEAMKDQETFSRMYFIDKNHKPLVHLELIKIFKIYKR